MADTADRRRIKMHLTSVNGHDKIRQTLPADLYARGGHWYVRYEEASDGPARTRATVRLSSDEIRILRHGDIRSEQTFVRGKQLPGSYETAQGRLPLLTKTRELAVKLSDEGYGTCVWTYDLEVAGEPAGRFRLRMVLEPGELAGDEQDVRPTENGMP